MHLQDATFDLTMFLVSLRQAAEALICNIGFEAAVHGLIFALVLGISGLLFKSRKVRFGSPLLAVAKKLTIFCVILAAPGAAGFVFIRPATIIGRPANNIPGIHCFLEPYQFASFCRRDELSMVLESLYFLYIPV